MRFRLFLLPVIYLIAVLLDLVSTYYGAGPELKNEMNWWVVTFNLGWGGLLLVNLVYFTGTILLFLYHKLCFRYETSTSTPRLGIAQTFRHYFTKNADGLLHYDYTWVKYLRGFLNGCGYVCIRINIFTHFFFAITNFMNGFFLRYYVFSLDTSNPRYSVLDITGRIGPAPAPGSFWDTLLIHWVAYEHAVDFIYLPWFVGALTFAFVVNLYMLVKKEIELPESSY
jgi:hypothetical protein